MIEFLYLQLVKKLSKRNSFFDWVECNLIFAWTTHSVVSIAAEERKIDSRNNFVHKKLQSWFF